MDESDTDEILAIDELRALRDRMGADAAAPGAIPHAAPVETPDPLAAITPEARADPWEELRRQARDRRHWGRVVAAGGGLVLAGAAVGLLVLIAHHRSGPTTGVTVPAPTVSAVPVSPSAPAAVSSPAQPSAVLPLPIVVPAPTTSVEDTTGPGAAVVPALPAPPATHRRKPPTSVAPPASGPPPAMPGAAPDRAGAPSGQTGSSCDAGCTDPTLTRTPTSWSPASPP